jgi:anti-sigma factor RsiW
VEEDLSALLDGELEASREAEVRAHTQGCARCRARLAALARVDVLLAAAPVRETSAALDANLRARIAAEGQAAARPEPARPDRGMPPGRSAPTERRSRRARPFVAALLAAAAALALYLAVGRSRTPLAPAPEPRVAQAPEPVAPPQLPAPPEPESVEPVAPEAAPVAIAEQPAASPQPATPAQDPDFDALPAEEIAVGLELDTAADLEVIANLELLEALVALEEGRG